MPDDANDVRAQAAMDEPTIADRGDELTEIAEFRRRLGLQRLIDVHTHFMPERMLAKVWAYFDAAGPLVGRRWPIAYREEEQRRLELLRGFGVRAFTSLLYAHRPGMARSLNHWAAGFCHAHPGLSALGDVLRRAGRARRRAACLERAGPGVHVKVALATDSLRPRDASDARPGFHPDIAGPRSLPVNRPFCRLGHVRCVMPDKAVDDSRGNGHERTAQRQHTASAGRIDAGHGNRTGVDPPAQRPH